MLETGVNRRGVSRVAPSKRLRVAFLGGAYESAVGRVHRIAVEMDQRFELVAGCFSRNADINTASAARYGVHPDRVYGSLENLLEHETGKMDAILILTPTDQHASQIVDCLEAGVPVICEKALVASVNQAVEVREKILSGRGFLAVTYNYTGYPMLRELKMMVDSGRFGKIQQIHLEMPQEGFARLGPDGTALTPQEWRLHDGLIPTLSLDLGVHLHNIVFFLTGQRPMELVSTSESYGNFRQIIDNVSCLAKYSGNIHCSFWYGKTALGTRNGLKVRVYGEKGSAEWLQEDSECLRVADNLGGRMILDRGGGGLKIANQGRYTRFKAGHPSGFIEAFANYYFDVADALEVYKGGSAAGSQSYVFGIDAALEGLRMLEAIAKSFVEKRWVKFE